LFNLSFIIKEWGKTTMKTEVVVTVAGNVPVAICATGVPGIAVPSAPTTNPKNSFNLFKFHFLAF